MADIHILDNDPLDSSLVSSQNSGVSPVSSGESFLDRLNTWFIKSQSLNIKDKVAFYRMLSTMINAGLTVLKSLTILEAQEKNPLMKLILNDFINEIKQGGNFSSCLNKYPNNFSGAEIGVIESGEKTGKLNSSLVTLSAQVEKIASINSKLKGALIYPAAIIVVVFGVIAVLMTLVVPKLLDMFTADDLPMSTKILIGVSDTFVAYWWLMLIGIFLFVVGVSVWRKTPTGKYQFDKIILYLPVFGDIVKKIALSKFAKVLSSLLESGVSIVESLRITSEAVGNEVYRQKLMLLREDVKSGLKIAEGLEGDPNFPDMMVQMISVGEKTAQIDKVITKVADFYDEEVDNKVSVINKLLEPIIIVFMAVAVGFIAVGIMQPIMNMADKVSGS